VHIELIDPREKLAEELGGFGCYVPPREPATVADLLIDAATRASDSINLVVWKVARRSVNWTQGRHRSTRRLRIRGAVIPAKVLGGDRHWYFVAASASDAVKKLKPLTR
jgi:hypothetical protein